MDFEEINSLINIRNYMAMARENPTIPNNVASDISNMLLLIDRKIVSLILNDEFKQYLNYKDIKKVIKEVVDLNNIKSGLIR